jgi:hypothetical protein
MNKNLVKTILKKIPSFSLPLWGSRWGLGRGWLILVLTILTLSSATAQNVYVGGDDGTDRATVWENNTPTPLSTGSGTIFSVVVDKESDVYAAGIENVSGYLVAKLWKNNVEEYAISGTSSNAWAHSVAMSDDGDVYMAGDVDGVGKVWKNGVAEPKYIEAISLRSVFISGNDVYAAGVKADGTAGVWKNGELLYNLVAGEKSIAYSVAVVGDDVYTAGYGSVDGSKWFPGVFKNDTPIYMLGAATSSYTPEYPLGLFIAPAGAIYVAGHEIITGKAVARVWKNNVQATLNTTGWDRSVACSVFVFGSDIYVAGIGYEGVDRYALLWKNNDLPTKLATGFSANSVFVAPPETGIAETHISTGSTAVYPNPTSGELTVETDNYLSVQSIEIFDMMGRTVGANLCVRPVETHGRASLQYNITSLPSGVYFVRITTEAGIITKKIIKQ